MIQPTWEIRQGDVLDRLREMPDESVHMVVTSPPYWGLRDYGTATWDGGDEACGHVERAGRNDVTAERLAERAAQYGTGQGDGSAVTTMQYRDVCLRCGARRVDQQIGLEPDPATYIGRMVEVFAEVRRVLRSDGTCWVNMGDGYMNGQGGRQSAEGVMPLATKRTDNAPWNGQRGETSKVLTTRDVGLKPKDLIGMPWRLAFALQADGWWLRSEIIWVKPNPMPESVTDRPTKAHEQIFLLTKRGTYFYDSDAIREPQTGGLHAWTEPSTGAKTIARPEHGKPSAFNNYVPTNGRNARSVWTIATQPYAEAHFATFPEELPRRCILAGTSERGVCPACGSPWRRVVKREPDMTHGARTPKPSRTPPTNGAAIRPDYDVGQEWNTRRTYAGMLTATTTGWEPTCAHAGEPVPAVVLDPFAGSGTTLMVAVRHGRSAIGVELNPEYAAMARRRIESDHGAVEPTNGHTPEGRGRGTQGRLAL